VEPFKAFFKAEEYHRNYFERNPEQAYCRLVIEPKMNKMRKRYPDKLKKGTYSKERDKKIMNPSLR
jgi:hypothetical protein